MTGTQERHIVSLMKKAGAIRGEFLELVQSLPTVLDRCERPALAGATNSPQSTLFGVERDALPVREELEFFVRREGCGANQTPL